MEFCRRQFLHLATPLLAVTALPRAVRADSYPSRPVRIFVGATAGGGTDIMARLMGQWLSQQLGQPFIIEDRAGAGTNLATEAVVRAAPDGYTLLLVTAANAINATLYDNLSFNFIRDIAPVAGLVRVPLVMVIHPSVPATTVPEFIAYAKANAGKVNMATGVNGGAPHVAGELFKLMTGAPMLQVPYKGLSLALSDLLTGQVQILFSGVPAAIEFIRSGKLRALGVTSTTRADALPNVPAVAEFVPGFEASQWYGVGAPKDTPVETIATLNREINAGLATPRLKTQLADLGGTMLVSTPNEFGALIAAETEKWAKVVKFSGAKVK
jgi:tripartite-type tricarboxylate transporter receptor subunit TctC